MGFGFSVVGSEKGDGGFVWGNGKLKGVGPGFNLIEVGVEDGFGFRRGF